jgi:chromosome segregation ATPase
MPYLQNEKTRAQAEIQAAEAEVTSLTAQLDAQQQAVASAQAAVEAARSKLAGTEAQRPALEGSVASADGRVADLDQQIQQHEQNEPEEFIERPNKPPLPNPQWRTWKARLDELTEQRSGAQADADAAHIRLNNLDQAIAQATAELQAAEAQATQAAAALEQLKQALAAAQTRVAAAHQRLDKLTQLSDEIDREPMNRTDLEQAAAELSALVMELEDAYAAARATSRAADAALASLMARRDQLTAALADVNNQLPTADTEVSAADSAAADLAQQIDDHLSGGL